MKLPQTLLDVAVSDEEASLRTGIFRFASELLRKTLGADPWSIQKLQPDWAKQFRLNCHHEFACTTGHSRDVKRINARTAPTLISTHILQCACRNSEGLHALTSKDILHATLHIKVNARHTNASAVPLVDKGL
jgi:hypothetical protein